VEGSGKSRKAGSETTTAAVGSHSSALEDVLGGTGTHNSSPSFADQPKQWRSPDVRNYLTEECDERVSDYPKRNPHPATARQEPAPSAAEGVV